MTTPTAEGLAVEQADRDAYAAYIRFKNGEDTDPAEISALLRGERDHQHGVQIAAMARTASLKAKDCPSPTEIEERADEIVRLANQCESMAPDDDVIVPVRVIRAAAMVVNRVGLERFFTPSQQPGERVEERARLAFPGAGEVFADMDHYRVIFRPGGGNYSGADETVAICSTGDHAGQRTSFIAHLLNVALRAGGGS